MRQPDPKATIGAIQSLPVPASLLGESPLWHPLEQVLYWCDIPGRALHRFDPAAPLAQAHRTWQFHTEVACCAARAGGGLLLALRDGLWQFDSADAQRTQLATAPYPTATQRFNDGKVDPQGRFWCGTIPEPRDAPAANLYRWASGRLQRAAGGVTVSNGLAWSAAGDTVYWADTPGHVVYACPFDAASGSLGTRRIFASFAPRDPSTTPSSYGGRPDGATVDAEGCYWVAMFEGGCLLRLSPAGERLQTITLPVRCPTMPCLGGPDLRTLYVTTSRENRPAQELADHPWSGQVLQMRVDVPGLPASLAA